MPRQYSLAALTAIELTPPELVDAAARTGYDAVGLRLKAFRVGEPQQPVLGDTPMRRETEARLRDTELEVLDIEVMFLTPGRDVHEFEQVFETGARLGARHALTLIDIADDALAAAKFAQLCELARPFGVSCALEFAAWLGVGSIGVANTVITRAAQPNAELLLDPFHLYRTGGSAADIAALEPARIRYAQYCDVPREAPLTIEAIVDEARFERVPPGEGGLPLREFLAALPHDIALGLEVPSRRLAQTLSLDERLKRTLRAAKRLCGDGDA
jgi:sugar phosphate isomerase/epimerase